MVRAREHLSLDEALHDEGEEQHCRFGGAGVKGQSQSMLTLERFSDWGDTL